MWGILLNSQHEIDPNVQHIIFLPLKEQENLIQLTSCCSNPAAVLHIFAAAFSVNSPASSMSILGPSFTEKVGLSNSIVESFVEDVVVPDKISLSKVSV